MIEIKPTTVYRPDDIVFLFDIPKEGSEGVMTFIHKGVLKSSKIKDNYYVTGKALLNFFDEMEQKHAKEQEERAFLEILEDEEENPISK